MKPHANPIPSLTPGLDETCISSIPLCTRLTSGGGQACKQKGLLDGTTGPLTQPTQAPGLAGAAEPSYLMLCPHPAMILFTEPHPHCAGADVIQMVMINNAISS